MECVKGPSQLSPTVSDSARENEDKIDENIFMDMLTEPSWSKRRNSFMKYPDRQESLEVADRVVYSEPL